MMNPETRREENGSMVVLEVRPETAEVAQACTLFEAYRAFLETIESTHCFHFARFREEIAALPGWYSERNGAVLLAVEDTVAAGCIAFRAVPDRAGQPTCELKRLFVLPEFRGRRLARLLVEEAIARAAERGFRRAILDTDVVSMPAAYALYRRLGFEEYMPEGDHAPSLRFLERALSPARD